MLKVSQRKLLPKLRECLEIVEDTDLMYEEPEIFAKAYSRLIRLLKDNRNCDGNYIMHNLGKYKSEALERWLKRVKKGEFN